MKRDPKIIYIIIFHQLQGLLIIYYYTNNIRFGIPTIAAVRILPILITLRKFFILRSCGNVNQSKGHVNCRWKNNNIFH